MTFSSISLSEIPEKSVILIEEEIGSVERVFLHQILSEAVSSGKKALYLAVHSGKEDIVNEIKQYGFLDYEHAGEESLKIEGYFNDLADISDIARDYDLCIIDPFPFLVMHKEDSYIVEFLGALKKLSRKEDIRFFLSMDAGVSKKSTESIARAIADGIIQFREISNGRKIERYANIPKMKGKLPPAEMIPILLTESGITIDTRQAIR
ncbi:MAG: ATPase domain-containing protein [Candidatus Altiarchaeia archaeon]